MSSASSEEEFELNYVKLDNKNEIRLLGKEDYEIEMVTFMMSIKEFGDENIGKNLVQFLKKLIPESNDLMKLNLDYSKQFMKIINADKKKGLCSSVNQILSIDFKDKFIFNKTNVENICVILTNSLNELKKYKIYTVKELKAAISKINYEKYDFFKIFSNDGYLKNKDSSKIDFTMSRQSSQCKSTTFSSIGTLVKDLYEETSELDENNVGIDLNRYHNEVRGMFYIDNSIKNIMCSSFLTKDYNYNEEEEIKKKLTKDCFYYPKSNKNTIPEQLELPIELILLLYKLKSVKTLIFQIKKVDEQFLKMAILILLNVKWLFSNGINDVKYDLGNEEMQQELSELFSERTAELYYHFQKSKNLIYYTGSYQARTINCWEPEEDIFFEKFDKDTKESNKKADYIYNIQPSEDSSTFDNHLCNIYNEFGNLTNLKYIRPISYTIKNRFNEFQSEQKFDDYDENTNKMEDLNISVGDMQRIERESISLNNTTSFTSKASGMSNYNQSLNNNNIQLNNANTSGMKSTPQMMVKFINKYKYYLEMIMVYSYFLAKNIKNIKKLSLYFHTPYSYEICQLFNMKLNFDNSNFLIFAKEIETLREANFSFNCLDDKSFNYIIGIIDKNIDLSSLKLSFFTPDINYFDYSLFNLCSSKKISLTKLFQEQKEYEIKYSQNQEKKMNYFILNERLLGTFVNNLINFFNLLKIKTLNNLEEFVMRFDIPLPLLDNENYIILIIKFLINIIIMLTFQENKIHTFKLLAPYLELDCCKMPYIRQLFREISLKDEIEEKMNNQNEIKERKKIKQRTLKEMREKEVELKERRKELKEKSERKSLLEKIKSKDEIMKTANINENNKINEEKNENDENDDNDDDEYDIDKKIEKYDFKRFNSVVQKKPIEQAARRLDSINVPDISNKKRSELNKNTSLENLVLQMKIYDLPEIFNICLMNNLSGLKSINFGNLDEITFIGFMNSYKKNYTKLINLTSLKITLGISITSYISIEKYVLEFININSPKIEEKFLFSDLQMITESKMKELVELVYTQAVVPKLVIQISNVNEDKLSKILTKYINDKKVELNTLIILLDLPELKKVYNTKILDCLSSFFANNKNRAIICKEMPNTSSY